jgi:integrase/recombinase XerD
MPSPTFSFGKVSTIFETTVATLRQKFDQVTDPAARALPSDIRHNRDDDAALLAADLL